MSAKRRWLHLKTQKVWLIPTCTQATESALTPTCTSGLKKHHYYRNTFVRLFLTCWQREGFTEGKVSLQNDNLSKTVQSIN